MLKFYKPLLAVGGICCINFIIYLRASGTIVPAEMIFAECARNSGRTSAALNFMLLVMLGYFGLKTIFKDKGKKKLFTLLAVLFAVNHLTHFFFVSQFFKDQAWLMNIQAELHGVITYFFIVIIPFLLAFSKRLTGLLYLAIICHFLNATYLIGITFYGRIKPVDPAYMHQACVFMMMIAVCYILFRLAKEKIDYLDQTTLEAD